jgi:uncharacterized protein (DUF2237 family)
VRQSIKTELRHNRFTAADLVQANVSTRVTSLYRSLCAEAGTDDTGQGETSPADSANPSVEHEKASGIDDLAGRFNYAAMEVLRTTRSTEG